MPKLALRMPAAFVTSRNLPLAFVVEEAVAFERGDVDVVAAVVVVVADGDAHAVHLDVEAAAGRDVGERAVAVVAVERVQRAAASRRPVLAVDEQDVGQPSPSASKKAQPEPIVSGRYFFPALPLLWTNLMPGTRRDVGELSRERQPAG